MVGGRSGAVNDEMLYRFEFPERPGALMHFLDRMSRGWNITLFHYRNHGADFGRVLVGMQIPATQRAAFRGFLRQLNYRYWDESGNPAYQLFLGA
jgi:threonine dehydratase